MLLEDVLKEFIFDCTLRKMTDRTIEEYNGNKPFFIKSIVEGTPAYNDGRIR